MSAFQEKGKPRIFTYCKDIDGETSEIHHIINKRESPILLRVPRHLSSAILHLPRLHEHRLGTTKIIFKYAEQ